MFQRLHIIAVGCLATLSMNSVGADTGMGEDKCMELTLAKSNLDLAMVGKAPMEPAEARSQFDALRSDLPDALDPHITAMLDISKAAEGLAFNDPQHPMSSGDFQEADAAYRGAVGPLCPSFNMDY